jgi:hypothetical protein
MVADIDQLQDVALRLLVPLGSPWPPVRSSWPPWPGSRRMPASSSAPACSLPRSRRRCWRRALVARSQRRQAALRARLTANLVDTFGAAEELWLNGADDRAAAVLAADDRALVEVALRDARAAGAADALGVAISGLTRGGHPGGQHRGGGAGRPRPTAGRPPSPSSPLACSRRSCRCRRRPVHLPLILSAGRRVLDLAGREPEVADPGEPAAVPPRFEIALHQVAVARGPRRTRWCSTGSTSGWRRARPWS